MNYEAVILEGRKIHPIAIPDGVYVRAAEPEFGHIDIFIGKAIRIAKEAGGPCVMVFNGTSVNVRSQDSTSMVLSRWEKHGRKYQASVGLS